MNMTHLLQKVERTIGGLKFAVIIIIIFSIGMTIGTFVESYHGADFAGRLIYKRWPFITIQLLMFLSILLAAFLRFPAQKRLYGFYIIHAGLIIIGIGSFVTWYAGVDGAINLMPNEPARQIVLNEDMLEITFHDDATKVSKKLPFVALETSINESYRDLKFLRYYPFSENELQYARPNIPANGVNYHSTEYQLFNPNVSEKILLSLHPEAHDFDSTATMGPLSLHYLPAGMNTCLAELGPSKITLWNSKEGICVTPESENLSIQTTSSGNRFFVYNYQGELLSFFPDFSPWPMDQELEVKKDTPFRAMSMKLFEENPQLFLLGKTISFYNKDEDKWEVHNSETSQDGLVDLPWMGLQVRVLAHHEQLIPRYVPVYTKPVNKNGAVVKGDNRALEVEVKGEKYWVTSTKPLSLLVNAKKIDIVLTKRALTLPFEFVLTRFKMDTDPGTNNPASYESFVKLFSKDGPSDHHIFMNNPLKYEGFTFYQASYIPLEGGLYASTLSANVDQGRWMKYLGSFMVTLGSMWHYRLNRRQIKNLVAGKRKEDE